MADAQPVFDKILDSCKHLFGSDETAVLLLDDEDTITLGAYVGKQHEAVAASFPAPLEKSPAGRAIRERRVVHYTDVANDPQLTRTVRRVAQLAGYESMAYAPMLSNGRGIGAIGASRNQGAFSDKDLTLLQTFADQAVIAIENSRLFNETKEALERQTATAGILRLIASSPSDVQPVMKAIVESACELCGAYDAVALLKEGNDLLFTAHHGPIPIRSQKRSINRHWTAGRAFIDKTAIHVHDLQAERDEFPEGMEMARDMGHRSIVSVPLLREGESIGALVLRRLEVNPFSEKQIALLQTFADQAVIAIENVRLFDEVKARTEDLRESLQQQTATADVLKVISRSTFDLQIVLDILVESATRLCEADHAWLFQRDGDFLRFKSSFGHGTATHERIRELFLRREVPINRGSITGRSASEGRVVHVANVLEDREYTWSEAQQIGGYRAALGAPLLRDGKVVGVIFVAKTKPEPFSEKQIELVTTFADQAVIAIENVRLFEDLQARTRDIAESLEQQTATSEVLGAISSSLEELAPLFQKILENAVRVCGAKFGTMNLYDGKMFDPVAAYNVPREYAETELHKPFVPHPEECAGDRRGDPPTGPYSRTSGLRAALSRRRSCGRRDLGRRRRTHDCRRSDAQGGQAGGNARDLSARRLARSTTSRSPCSAILPSRRSSPSKTTGC